MSERLALLITSLISALTLPPAPPKPSWFSRYGNWAQIMSALVATVALSFVGYQVYWLKQNASVAAARQVYMSYSEASLRYPQFSEPNLEAIKLQPVEYIRYKNFVAHMLFAYDEMLSVYDEPEWRRSFEEDIKYHVLYICNDMPPQLDETYFPKMRALLKAERNKCAAVKS